MRTVAATVSSLRGELTKHGGPTDEVVGQCRAEQPRRVRLEVPRWDVVEPRPFFEIADGEFDDGVAAVERIDLERVSIEIGEEGEVTPVGPQGGLGTDEPGAAHDETLTPVVAFGHLGLAARRVGHWSPGVLVDERNGLDHLLLHPYSHGEADVEAAQRGDGVVGPKPRVKAHDELAGCAGPADSGHELGDQASRSAPEPAGPRRSRAWSTSPVSARVATMG